MKITNYKLQITNWVILSLVILLLVISHSSYAAENGGQCGAFLSYGAGARSLGMGKAFVAVADDSSATYWNPAGLLQLTRPELTSLYTTLYEQTSYSFISYANPLSGSEAYGVNAVLLASEGFEGRDALNNITGAFSDKKMAGGISYARRFNKEISLGLGIKYVSESMANFETSKAAIDLGLMYRVMNNLNIGLVAQNAGSVNITSNTNDRLPLNIRIGASYKTLGDNLTIAVDADKLSLGGSIHGGFEARFFNKMLALRAGVDETEATAGVGLNLKDIGVDYSIGIHSLGTSHRVSISYKFGPEISEIKEAKARRLFEEANANVASGNYASAKDKIVEAVRTNPDDSEITLAQDRVVKLNEIFEGNIGLKDEKAMKTIQSAAVDFAKSNVKEAKDKISYALSLEKENKYAKKFQIAIDEILGKSSTPDDIASPSELKAKLNQALKHIYAGEYEAAINLCNEVISIDPTIVVAHKRLGSAYYMLGRMKEAEQAWKEASKLNPSDKELKNLLDNMKKNGKRRAGRI